MIILQKILVILQGVVSVGLILFVLLQQGKGADAGASFGGGASSTMFGSRGASGFLTRGTAILAVVFLGISLALAYIAKQQLRGESLLEQVAPAVPEVQDDESVRDDLPELPPEDAPPPP